MNGYNLRLTDINSPAFLDEFNRVKKQMTAICKNNDWTLVEFSMGHEYLSGFLRENKSGKYLYFAKQDWIKVFGNYRKASVTWHTDKFLFRSCKNRKDYTGGTNFYISLDSPDEIQVLFNRQQFSSVKKLVAKRFKKKGG